MRRGADNLAAHVQIVRQYGLPCVVTINSFPTDSPREIALVKELALNAGAETVVVHEGFGKGGAGAVDLAKAVVTACEKPNTFTFLTPDGTPIVEQIEAIATRVYGATGIDLQMQAIKDLERIKKLGLGTAPVCMAKTHMSLSHDPTLAQSADRLHPSGAQPGAERRRRLRRRALRRHAADARFRQDARVREDGHRRTGTDGGVELRHTFED